MKNRPMTNLGMVISVVEDGRLIFAKGYGYADLERRIPVRAGETLFRVASISKLFTWTAVMQLVEQGELHSLGERPGAEPSAVDFSNWRDPGLFQLRRRAGLLPLAKALLCLPWAILPLTGVILVFAWLGWRRKYWTRTGRVLYTILAVAGVAHVWFLIYWILLF
jgi:hypothetical protein